MKLQIATEGPETKSIAATSRGRELCRRVRCAAARALAEHVAMEHEDGLLHGACAVCVYLDGAVFLGSERKKRAA